MACEPPPPPKKAKSPPAAPNTISDLTDDLLREIFIRLPSLPTLVRAALTCHSSLRAVRSSPAFRRRFRELHSPPVLGIFLDIFETYIPAFRPVRLRSDADLTAAVRGADFLLTRLPDDEGSAPEWVIMACHNGYVVLLGYNTDHIAVYNPLTRALHLFPVPPDVICEDMSVEYSVVSPEEDQGPFRVICVCRGEHGAQSAVISSKTREWQVFPWVDAASMQPARLQPEDEKYSYDNGKLVNGSVYWTEASLACARVLDTATLQFSRIDLPPHIEGQGSLTFGQTSDQKLCIVGAVKLSLVVWSRGTDDDGSERWMLDKTYMLEQEIVELMKRPTGDHVMLKILAIENGFVYLSTYYERDTMLAGWFLSFCLETRKLNEHCPIIHADDTMYPYIMAWPSLLVRDKPSSSS